MKRSYEVVEDMEASVFLVKLEMSCPKLRKKCPTITKSSHLK